LHKQFRCDVLIAESPPYRTIDGSEAADAALALDHQDVDRERPGDVLEDHRAGGEARGSMMVRWGRMILVVFGLFAPTDCKFLEAHDCHGCMPPNHFDKG
jgi:hypothetical protein